MIKIYLIACSISLTSCLSHATSQSNRAFGVDTTGISGDSLALPKAELTKIYIQSITDYIKAVNNDYTIKFDTLFFAKHVYGQPDDFPDIELPETIENTPIRLVSPAFGAQKQKDNHSSFLINLMGWVDQETAEFIFVAFSNNNEHQFDYYLNYHYDTRSKAFVWVKTRYENFLYKRK